MAILIPLTKVVLCALALPVRGRLETILMTCESAANATEHVIASTPRQSGRNNRFMHGFWHKCGEPAIPKPKRNLLNPQPLDGVTGQRGWSITHNGSLRPVDDRSRRAGAEGDTGKTSSRLCQ